jgi:hypothetical protein
MNLYPVSSVPGWRLSFLAVLSVTMLSQPGHSATAEGEESEDGGYLRHAITFDVVRIEVEMRDGCPVDTHPTRVIAGTKKARVKRGMGVEWVRRGGGDLDSTIYFNPFAVTAPGLRHTPTKIWTLPIPDSTPAKPEAQGGVEYKYTIAKQNCAPHDPHLVVVE